MNKASGGDGIPVELFQVLKDDVCIFLRLVVCQLLHLLLFSPIQKAVFNLVYIFLCCAEAFNFN